MLCDCPGLVFPSFANSRAEMMTCGVLNIDTMRDYVGPVQLIMSRIPKEVLECQYKVKLPPRESEKYTATVFLQLIAARKGWLTGSATPNVAIAARSILRDYTTGKLLYVTVRPDYDPEKHGELAQSGFNLDMSQAADQTEGDATNYELLEEAKTETNTTKTTINVN